MKKAKRPTSNIENPTPNAGERNGWLIHEGGGGDGRKYDLEERLLPSASAIIDLSGKLPDSRAGNHIAGQMLRSGTFIHKLTICLNELRETRRWTRLIKNQAWAKYEPALLFVLRESEELIRIFFTSVQTATRNGITEWRRQTNPARYPSGEAG